MIVTHRNLIAILAFCLAVIGISAAIRFDVELSFARNSESAKASLVNTRLGLSESEYEDIYGEYIYDDIDASFFEYDPKIVPKHLPEEGEATTTPPDPKISEEERIRRMNTVSARAYLVGNLETGEIYLKQKETARMPIASLTKLVTAVTAMELYKPDEVLEITELNTQVPPDGSMLKAEEKLSVYDLLHALLLNSSNVAAEVLASSTNRTAFLEEMSSNAWDMGMPQAYFEDSSGVHPRDAATALELFNLSKFIYKERPQILEITKKSKMDISTTTDHGSHNLYSTHPFVNYPDFLGGKTGRTPQAGDTMITMKRINDQPIVIIVLGSDYGVRARDTNLLIKKLTNQQ